MHSYTIGFIIALILMVWILNDQKKLGFFGNDSFFENAERSQIIEDYIYQPKLIHKVNIPAQW